MGIGRFTHCFCIGLALAGAAQAQNIAAAHAQSAGAPCPRPHVGSVVTSPPDIASTNGSLHVDLAFRGYTDRYARVFYCYITPDGAESPTLRVHPGDEVTLRLTNELTPANHLRHDMEVSGPCGSGKMTPATTNLHFHGLSIPPACHQDDVISTLVQPTGNAYEYRFRIPPDQPPGIYWYHPHPHGFSESQVLGGASGALIVEGIERANPKVAGLPERVIVLRDQLIPGANRDADEAAGPAPSKDVSINFVPVMYPAEAPAAIVTEPDQREFWRILNAAADTYFDVQVRTGHSLREARHPLPLELIAMDGAPVARDPESNRTHILLSPGARAEFILTTPPEGVYAQLVTRAYDAGAGGESAPERALANLFSSRQSAAPMRRVPASGASAQEQFAGLLSLAPARQRKLYFSEARSNPLDPKSPMAYFVTVDGKAPKAFDMNFTSPDVTVEQGAVEDWVIENRASEAHSFHIHQIHFQLLERDGRTVNEPLLRDTIDLPFWDGKSDRYPSVKLRMDFRSPDIVGTFLFHCHILEHEDAGMMGSIRVVAAPRVK